MSKRKSKSGLTSQILPILAVDSSSTTGAGLASLVYNSAGLSAKYKRAGDSSWTTITLASMTGGTYTSGGFIESDSGAVGSYEFCPPNTALAAGVSWVVIEIYGAANLLPIRIEIELDAVDYQDAANFGLSKLSNHTAQAADHTAGIADIPTVAEFDARTLVAANYFDPAADAVANVTTVGTLAGHTAQTGDSFGRIGALGVGLSVLATSVEVTSITNNTRANLLVPAQMRVADSGGGNLTYKIRLTLFDTAGNMEVPDSAPTISSEDESGNSRDSNLGSTTMALVSTGVYESVYTVPDTHVKEQLVFAISVTEGGATRTYNAISVVVDDVEIGFTVSDRTTLQAVETDTQDLQAQVGTAGDGLTALATAASLALVHNNTAYGDGHVWFEPDTSNTGTVAYVNGTLGNPASNLNDAVSIAQAINVTTIPRIKFKPGSQEGYSVPSTVALPTQVSLDLNGMYLDVGTNLTLGGAGVNIFSSAPGGSIVHHAARFDITSGSYIYGLWFNGTAGLTLRHGVKIGYGGFAFSVSSIDISPIVGSVPIEIYGTGFQYDGLVFDFSGAAAGATLILNDCWGHVQIDNLVAGMTVKYLGWGKATLDASCTGGTLYHTCHVEVIDNSTGGGVAAEMLSSNVEPLAAADTATLVNQTAIKAVTDLLVAAQQEPTGEPADNETPLDKLAYMFAALINQIDVIATTKKFYNKDDALLWKKTVSDDGTTYQETRVEAP